MQKKLIALAVAGLSTAAFAQTNVTIYGVADVSAQGTNMSQGSNPSTKPSGGAFNLKSNSSLIGFKGTEDLGNGLKGLFQIETNVNLTGTSGNQGVAAANGTTFGSMRDSYVGVDSKYGTVMGGYLSTPYRSALNSFDVMPGATGDGRIENIIGKTNATTVGSGTVVNGANNVPAYTTLPGAASSIRATALAYALPTMYGFNGSIAYTGSNSNGNNENTAAASVIQSALSMNLGWSGYGVDIKGAFQQAKLGGATTPTYLAATTTNPGTYPVSQTAGSGYTSYLIGVGYTGVPGLKLAAVYNRNTVGTNSAITGATGVTAANTTATGATSTVSGMDTNKGSNNQYWLGASYRFGNNEPRLSWAQSSNTNYNGGTPNDGARQVTANWGYYLSKRTQVYGLVSAIKNNQNGQYTMASGGTNLNPTAGQALLTYGAGLRTNF